MKQCKVCKEIKELTMFRCRKGKGYENTCNSCRVKSFRSKYAPYSWSNKLVKYKQEDIRKGLEYDLTDTWYMLNIDGEPCYYCGSLENIGCDRLDNTRGHTTDNCVPCCFRCNSIRNNFFTPEQMKRIAEFIKTF